MTIFARVPMPRVTLEAPVLDRLMPMHLQTDGQGGILSVGPTLTKLLPEAGVLGAPIGEVMALRRPAVPTDMATLRARIGGQLHMAPINHPDLVLRGHALPTTDGGLLVNLSLGIWVNEAVRRFGLTVADFAATDLTVELLYLLEAKSAVMAELRSLNLRLHGAKVAAEEQAMTDTLTGLRNRRALDLRLDDLVAQGQTFGLMHLDLDFFKQVNDTHGHAAGDHVLREVARILAKETRTTDLIARVGGDEFVLVFPGLAEEDRLCQIAERIIDQLTRPIIFEEAECLISGSIGLTISTYYATPDVDVLHADADEALYASKRAGRGRATLHRINMQSGAGSDADASAVADALTHPTLADAKGPRHPGA